MFCPKNVQVSFKNIFEKNLYADEVVHQPPHAGGLSSLGDLGIHIIIMIYHEISYIKKTFAGNAINIIWPEHVKITVEEGQGIYIYILFIYLCSLFVS